MQGGRHTNADRMRGLLSQGGCSLDDAEGNRNRAKSGADDVMEEPYSLLVLLVLLGEPTDVDTGDKGEQSR